LESREHFLLANVLQVSGTGLGQIVPVILAVVISPSLAIVIPAAVIMRALTVAAILMTVYRDEGPWSFKAFDRHQARKLLSYGGWVTVTGVIGPILQSADQFVVGSFLGVAAVAHYAVPMNLVMRSQILPSALIRTLFPRLSNLEHVEAQRLASRAIVALAYGYGAICAPAIILAPTFFRFWISADFAATAAPIAVILFFGGWINGLAFVPFGLLQSQGRPHVTGTIHAAEVIPFVVLLWRLTSTFGIIGAAVAWSLRCTAEAIFLFVAARVSIRDLLWTLIPLAVLIASAALGDATSTPWQAFGLAAVIGLLSLILGLIVVEKLRRAALAVFAKVMRILFGERSKISAEDPRS
jgi:O-antigen/teichoic acid export membrane protein